MSSCNRAAGFETWSQPAAGTATTPAGCSSAGVVRCEREPGVGVRTPAVTIPATALLSPSLPPLLQTAGGVKKGNQKSRVCSVPFPGSPKPPCTLTTVPAASLVPPSSRSSSPTLSAVRGGSLGESGSGGGGGGVDGLRAAEGLPAAAGCPRQLRGKVTF